MDKNIKEMEGEGPKCCQSCGMPLTDSVLGTNADGSKNDEYCVYCYKDGAFTGDFTMEEMAEFCSQFVERYNGEAGAQLTREEYRNQLLQYYPKLKRWSAPASLLPNAHSPIKRQLIEEVNALGIKDMPEVDNLFVIQGSVANQEYHLNGHSVVLLDDDATYWGTQVGKRNVENRCFGVACDERYILVSEYGWDGSNPEIVLLKRRGEAENNR